jgi:hypothetical protein
MEKCRTNKIGYLLFFFTLVITQTGFSQSIFVNGISLTIAEDSVVCDSPCNAIKVTLTYRNTTKHDLVVFRLGGGPFSAFGPLAHLCELPRVGTGTQFAVCTTDGELIHPSIFLASKIFTTVEQSDSAYHATVSRLDSLLREMKGDFLSHGLVLKSQEERTYVNTVPLTDLELEVGRYLLQFCYYSGEKTLHMPELKNIVEDKNFSLYQGCATSRSIVFVVK